MGTKNNPGKYDCFAKLEPDEPYFVLMGRDKHAPMMLRMWAAMRALDDEDPDKVAEAIGCAEEMELWRIVNRPKMKGGYMIGDQIVVTEELRTDEEAAP